MTKQIILGLLIISLMNGCGFKRIFGGAKGHGKNYTPPVVRTR
jgi:hypothetical protein